MSQEIRIYTTSSCPYCDAAKRELEKLRIPYRGVDISQQPELRERLSRENNNYRMVPMIFVGSEFIGGYTDLKRLIDTGQFHVKAGITTENATPI